MSQLINWIRKNEALLVVVTVVALLRLPTLFEPAWYGDENIYLTIGQGIRKGLVLYKGITDYPNKPPFIYLLAALVQSVWGFRLVLLFWNSIHAVFMWIFLKTIFVQRRWLRYALMVIFIGLTATPLFEGNIANGEIFMIMPVTAGMLLLWNEKLKIDNGKLFIAGLFFAMGFLFKIPVGAEMVAAGLFFFLAPLFVRRSFTVIVRGGLWFALGWLSLVGFMLVVHAWQGVGPVELGRIMIGSSSYVAVWRPQMGMWAFFTFSSLPSRLLLAGALSVGLLWFRKFLSQPALFASLWTIWALFGALLSARPYLHYLLQVVPPLIILLGVILRRVKRGDLVAGMLVFGLVEVAYIRFGFRLGPLLTYYKNFGLLVTKSISKEEYYQRFDGRTARNYAVAKFLRERTQPLERLYVWGTEPDIYVLADRLPVGRLTTSFHVEDLNEYSLLGNELVRTYPAYIVWMDNEPRDFPELKQLLESRYANIAQFNEAVIYHKLPTQR